ncbi:hypothetical protein C2S52_017870 [Perilla frutescens var. hirtella]|nr:hypothetical protein C2S52_017870 [Perilla frutescens var. hirtella]
MDPTISSATSFDPILLDVHFNWFKLLFWPKTYICLTLAVRTSKKGEKLEIYSKASNISFFLHSTNHRRQSQVKKKSTDSRFLAGASLRAKVIEFEAG